MDELEKPSWIVQEVSISTEGPLNITKSNATNNSPPPNAREQDKIYQNFLLKKMQ
jgi:hypothetical protein